MNATAYYNENDPFAAGWLRNLIRAGHIAPGEVDERSIVNVRPDDLRAFTQCHFFAGIGGWSIALRLAGWPDDRPVWTGSCPCQPFSAAGAGKAADDERHLWPAWLPLIAERRPATVFGEQVEAAIGWGWLDAVFADLEEQGYACGATVLPAASVGAPHIRQRCWFVAADQTGRRIKRSAELLDGQRTAQWNDADGCGSPGAVADAGRERIQSRRGPGDAGGAAAADPREGHQRERLRPELADGGGNGELGDALGSRLEGLAGHGDDRSEPGRERPGPTGSASAPSAHGGVADSERIGRKVEVFENGGSGAAGSERQAGVVGMRGPSHWSDADWLPCTDGKARPVRPGSFPLAHGVQRRTSKLRAYGNAIVPQVAAEFIAAYLEV